MARCNCCTAEKPVSVRDYFRFRFGNGDMFVRIVDAYQVGYADFLGLGVDK